MKKYIIFVLVFVACSFAQTTTTTGTIQYPDGSAFADGTVKAIFTPPTGIQDQNLYKINGSTFTYEVSGTMDASGHFSIVLTNDHLVSPQGGRWNFVLCSAANIACNSSLQDVFGASIDLSALINADIATQANVSGFPFNLPRFYTDVEAKQDPKGGALYFNYTSKTVRLYNGSSWAGIGGGGSGTVTNFSVDCTGVSVTIFNCNVTNPTSTPQLTLTSPLSLKGNTSVLATVSGAVTNTHCAQWDSNNNLIDSGSACGTVGGSVLLAPTLSQHVVQPVGTTLDANSFAQMNFVVTDYNWSQSPAADLSVAGAKTITLTPCPKGIDVSNNANAPYAVYIATTGTPEVAFVTGGTCTSGGASGTITLTTVNTHSAGYTVASANAGIQEAVNESLSPNGVLWIPPTLTTTAYIINNTVYFKRSKMTIHAEGAVYQCNTRSTCLYLGDRGFVATHLTMYGGRSKAGINVDGVHVITMSRTANVVTIETDAPHGYTCTPVCDYVWTEAYNTNGNFHVTLPITSIPDATHYTFNLTGADIASATSFGWSIIQNSFIEDNADGTYMQGIKMSSSGSPNKFTFGIVINNDQQATVNNFANEGSGNILRNSANFVGSYILVTGQGNAGVVTVENSELSMQCAANGITMLSGNGLRVLNNVIQAQSQWNVKFEAGLQNMYSQGTHYEQSVACNNPFYPSGIAKGSTGHIQAGQTAYFFGSSQAWEPQGRLTQFTASAAGANRRNYWISFNSSVRNHSALYFAGFALTNNSGTVDVYFPQPTGVGSGTIDFDVILSTGVLTSTAIPITGTANSLATAQSVAANCTNGMCHFVDTHGATSAYTVNQAVYRPTFYFWPANALLEDGGGDHGGNTGWTTKLVSTEQISSILNVGGPLTVGNYALICAQDSSLYVSSYIVECLAQTNVGGGIGATILNASDLAGNGPAVNSKGRLNFGRLVNTIPYDLITVFDSAFLKTSATEGNRPVADANDCAISLDQGTSTTTMGMAFRCNKFLDNYIGSLADGTSWLEQLSATLKTFKIPITTNSQITSTLATGTAPLVVTSTTPVANLTLSQHPKVQACGTTSTCSATAQTTAQIIQGSAALASASPSTVTITGFSPAFTSTSTYNCTAGNYTDSTHSLLITKVSASSITITGPNTVTDTVSYICVGN